MDPINRMDGDTPLHTAVKFAAENAELGLEIVKVLIECGADPRYTPPNSTLFFFPMHQLKELGNRSVKISCS